MSNKCRNIGEIVFIIGIISSCIMAFILGRDVPNLSSLIIISIMFAAGVLTSYIVYVAMTALGEILDNQETILASIEHFTNRMNTDEEVPDDSWKCTCGRINPNYTGTCGCGIKKI